MKWCMYIVIVLAILVALYGCDESPVPTEAPPKVQQSDDASAAGLMLDTLGYPKVEAAKYQPEPVIVDPFIDSFIVRKATDKDRQVYQGLATYVAFQAVDPRCELYASALTH